MWGRSQRTGWAHRMRSYQSKQADINRLIINYLLREGYKEAAQRFDVQAKKESGAHMDSHEYRNAVRAGQLQYAMDMAKKLYQRFESDNYMYFHMQQMHLIELIRERKLGKAVSSTKTDSTPSMTPMEQLTASSAADLWHQGNSHLDSTIMKHEQATSMEPKLVFLIKLILWAQSKLDNYFGGCVDNVRFDVDGDFELELIYALQQSF
ncbi:hypothetical protein ACLKA6_020017 [Drosophila palustris]